ncbi:hypothetical protein BCR41DRAFT_375755 [Lobosporangium transversale]|uniref:Uncharacterized protein n=1 Tax=Lobosporangium transversale TaxID=64571 RepID=A0A1Y2G629_9FUNG|nr:hypothetical protein BCR41DRAFT_375755 [Lobosporangium transversale]ORY96110.1 hypothetical protein BCR41DRAFT_375755 [Lobosporangium transversale]|eukprot:XP_021875529.1 hypothetical protein BCR41DRAFT_375755 [Lobosporangium transversale]
MSERACEHFSQSKKEVLVEDAKSLSIIADFEDHPSLQFLQNYIGILREKGVIYLKKKVVADRGIINGKYLDEVLPDNVSIEDKVLKILEYLCGFIIHPPFLTSSPSENDCLHVWVSIFELFQHYSC